MERLFIHRRKLNWNGKSVIRQVLTLCSFFLAFTCFGQRSLKIRLSSDRTEFTIKYKGEKGDILHLSDIPFVMESFHSDSIEKNATVTSPDSLLSAWLYFKLEDGRYIRYYHYDETKLTEEDFEHINAMEGGHLLAFSYGNHSKRVRYTIPLMINPQVLLLDPKVAYFSIEVSKVSANGEKESFGIVTDTCKW